MKAKKLLKNPGLILYRYIVKKRLSLNYLPYLKGKIELVGCNNINVGKLLCCGKDVKIEAWNNRGSEHFSPEIIIGNNVFFQDRTHITAINKIIIGNNVLTGSDVLISDNNHGRSDCVEELMIPPRDRKLYSKGPIIIGNNVWIGDKACILGAVKIGEGSVIGANTVISKDVPAYSVVVGNPSRIIRTFKINK